MAIEVKRAGADDYGRTIKALICGDPGAGKTRTASTWPDVLYMNAEGGLMSVADRRPATVTVTKSSQIGELRSMLDQEPEVREKVLGVPVQTVVIDTIDEVARILVRERLDAQKKETMAIPDWGWLGDQLRLIVRSYRNLPINLIVNCHMKQTEDADGGGVSVRPGIQGGFSDEIAGFVDLALLLTARTVSRVDAEGDSHKEMVRVLQAFPDNRHTWIKDRSGKLPMEFPINFDDDWERINDLIYGHLDDLEESETVSTIATPTPDPEPAPAKKPAKKAAAKKAAAAKAEAEPTLPEPDPGEEKADAEKAEPTEAPTDAEPETAPEPEPEADPEAEPSTPVEDGDEAAAEPEAAAPAADTSEAPAEDEVQPEDEGSEETVPPAETPAADGMVCEACSGAIENEDQRDLAQLRYRKDLCRSCFANGGEPKT